MNKWLALVLGIALMLSYALAEDGQNAADMPSEESWLFIALVSSDDGPVEVPIAVDADAAPVVEVLGEPAAYFESESCAFQGLDKVYTYPSFVLYTYPLDGKDYIMSLYLMDDTVTTAEGAYIGMRMDAVSELYGEPTTTAEGSVTYEKGGCALSFLFDSDGLVNAITYSSIAANAQGD